MSLSGLRRRCWQGCLCSGGSGRIRFLTLSSFGRLPTFLCLHSQQHWVKSSSLCFSDQFSDHVFPCLPPLPLVRALTICWDHPDNPEPPSHQSPEPSPHLQSPLALSGGLFTGLRGWVVDIFGALILPTTEAPRRHRTGGTGT